MRWTQGEKMDVVNFLLSDLQLYRAVITDISVKREELALEHNFLQDITLSITYAAIERAELLHTLSCRNKLLPLTKKAYELMDFWLELRDVLAKEKADDT